MALHGCELLVLGPGVTDDTIEQLAPREVQVVADAGRRAAAIAATARRIAGRSLGVVFSGGGARALAHLGALEELRAAGLQFDRVAGVSLGSFVAATVASDYSMEMMRALFQGAFVQGNPSNDYAIPAYSLLRGAKARRMLNDAFGERRIEELPMRFFCLSCDLISRREVVHRTGRIADALYSSAALPGIFPPVVTDGGQLLVDGGVLDNLPVAMMARTGEGPVIAVDVSGRPGNFRRPQRSRLARLGRPVRRALTGNDGQMPRLGETLMRTVTVGSIDTFAAAHENADIVITPEVEGIGLLDWKAFPRVVELGRAAARDALARHPRPDRLRGTMADRSQPPVAASDRSPRRRRFASGAAPRDRLPRRRGRVRRRDDRQHRLPEHRAFVPGNVDLLALLGAQRLQHRVRRVPRRRRADRRRVGPAADVRVRARGVHGRVAALRDRALAVAADHFPGDPGARCRVPRAVVVGARAERVPA